jgi:hypothetical protein
MKQGHLLATLGALIEHLVEYDVHVRLFRTDIQILDHVLLDERAALHLTLLQALLLLRVMDRLDGLLLRLSCFPLAIRLLRSLSLGCILGASKH